MMSTDELIKAACTVADSDPNRLLVIAGIIQGMEIQKTLDQMKQATATGT